MIQLAIRLTACLSIVLFTSSCNGFLDSSSSNSNSNSNSDSGSDSASADVWVFSKNESNALTLESISYSSFIYDNIVIDLNNDGYNDFLTNGPTWDSPAHMFRGSYVPLQALINRGDYTFENNPDSMFGDASIPQQVHTRAISSADFNDDGVDDFILFGTGWDVSPYSGEKLQLILSEGSRWVDYSQNLNWEKLGFYHGGAIGDIDGDGDIDIFTSAISGDDFASGEGKFIPLINDGNGIFSYQPELFTSNWTANLPNWLWNNIKLVDFDGDNCTELILGSDGHQYHDSYIVWNKCDGTGYVGIDEAIALPHSGDFVRHLDTHIVDINDDGKRDIMIALSKDNYTGKYIQVLVNKGDRNFVDETTHYFPGSVDSTSWIARIYTPDIDLDGDMDLILLVDFAIPLPDGEPHLVWENVLGEFIPVEDENLVLSGSLVPIDVDSDGDIDLVSRVTDMIGDIDQVVSFTVIENLSID